MALGAVLAVLTLPAALANPAALAATRAPEFIPADTGSIHEFSVPTDRAFPSGITRGPDGNLWFTELFGNNIARVTPGGAITEFPLPQGDGTPQRITTGPDGNLWFTEFNPSRIGRITPQGNITEFPLESTAHPFGITTGPDGALWFTELIGLKIGRISTTGAITEFPLPNGPPDFPIEITTGPDGNLWFTAGNFVGKMTTTGTVTEYQLAPVGVAAIRSNGAFGITVGPDGNLWFTENAANRIGRITTKGVLTEFPLPTTSVGPTDITVGPDGNLWFAENNANRIGRITTAGVITEVHIPTPMSGPNGITTGPDGKIWFTQAFSNQVANLNVKSLKPPAGPCLVVNHDLTLQSDVGPCRGDGILVTGSNLTLNLNGHRVLGADRRLGDFAGVHLLGVSGVTVAGGSGSEISGFDAGVLIDFGSRNTVKGINIHDNLGAPDTGSNLGDGISVLHSSNNVLAGNLLTHNGVFDGIGVLGVDSNNNMIRQNAVRKSTDQSLGFPGGGTGIIVSPFLENEDPRRGESVRNNNVIDNLVENSVSSGITNLSNIGATIQGNVSRKNGFFPDGSANFPGNGIGVQALLFADHVTNDKVLNNRVSANSLSGIQVLSEGNQITNNVATGDLSFDLQDTNPDCDSNVWFGNVWGTGGFDPPCVTAGGHGPNPALMAGIAAQAKPRVTEPATRGKLNDGSPNGSINMIGRP